MKNTANFAGFDDWIEIFKGGKQTDSAGRDHDGDALIDQAVSSFNQNHHEPPAVIGHPAQDAPAFGWVEAVKADVQDGVKRLYAKFRQVIPEFEEMVKAGMFKKRSASFYPDGRLRHVGWLGAMPPAVKGLSDVKFSTQDNAFNFENALGNETKNINKKEKANMKFQEFMEALMFWKKIQDDPDADLPELTISPTEKPAGGGAKFTETDIEAAKAEAAKAAKAEAEAAVRAEFAESETKRRKDAAKAEIKTFIDAGIEKGTIPPAWKDGGLAEFMESLDAAAPIEFGEGKDKKTGLAWFKDFLAGLGKQINFSEVADRSKDVKTGGAGLKLDALVQKKLQADKTLTYGAAFSEVQRENPALVAEYQQEMKA